MADYDVQLDLNGVPAPMNLLRVRRALEQMQVGQTLLVVTNARRPVRDFEALAVQSGNRLMNKQQVDDTYHFVLRKT